MPEGQLNGASLRAAETQEQSSELSQDRGGVTDSYTRGDCSCMGLEGGCPQERMEKLGRGPGLEPREHQDLKTKRRKSQ